MKLLSCILFATLLSGTAIAQDSTAQSETIKEKKGTTIAIDREGLSITDASKPKKEEKEFDVDFFMFDIGFNSIHDKTDYSSAAAQNFLKVPDVVKNENLFSLRTGKSINVNIWPIMAKWRLVKTDRQKIYLAFGAGLQMYNFRFTKNISYVNEPNPAVIVDSISFSKNKLGFTYASIPLMMTFKTKLAGKAWLVYGAGITGGYRIGSWTKQISDQRGKDKNHDKFNFNDFNSCLTGEIGLDGYFRFYATYQLTPMHENALDQHPFCIGLRFGGV